MRNNAGRKGPWWDRSDTKWVTEALWSSGVLTTATRVGFARHYDLTERVLPPEVVAREVDDDEAVRELTLRAAGALGIGTEADIRDYFRLAAEHVKPAIAKLVADGELERVEVDGWTAPAYLRAGQIVPRRDRGTALLCPFDPLIFFRPRVERLFGISGIASRSTCPRAETSIRLLRMAFSARRQTRRSRRPEGRTHPGCAEYRRRVRRTGRAAVTGRGGAGAGVADDGVVAGVGEGHGRRARRPGCRVGRLSTLIPPTGELTLPTEEPRSGRALSVVSLTAIAVIGVGFALLQRRYEPGEESFATTRLVQTGQ